MFIRRFMSLGLALLLTLGLAACGVDDSASSNETGELVIGITDADGDFRAYAVDVTSIELERADGTKVETLPLTTRIDFSQYVDLTEFLTAATIPLGNYVAASMTLDYSNADIQVEVNNAAVSATVEDGDGNPITTLEVDVSLAGQNRLTILPGVPAYLTLDFDLQSSNSVDTSGVAPVVTVEPVLLADVALEEPKEHRLRGLLSEVDVNASRIKLAMRPFALRQGDFGGFNAYVDSDTVYEIDGISYSGNSGLAQMDQLSLASWMVVYGSLNTSTRRFEASEVYAGNSVPGSDQDSVVGVVLARNGDQLSVDAGAIVTAEGVLIFNQQVSVDLSATTKITRQLSVSIFGKDDISVGQRVALLGELNADNTAMATTNHARMLLNQVGGTAVSVNSGELVLDLQHINGRLATRFDFSGTGTGSDADEANYQVNTGSLSLAGVDINDPVRVRGFVTAFGAAPADFDATTVIEVADVPASLLVTWAGGDSSPFSSSSVSGMVLDLSGSILHHVSRHWLVTDLSALPQATTLAPRSSGNGLFAINVSGTVYVYGTFEAFETALSERLAGGRPVQRVAARGQFDDAATTLTLNSMSVVFGNLLN